MVDRSGFDLNQQVTAGNVHGGWNFPNFQLARFSDA